jgi:DnaJ-domain-containing protein 1
MPTARRHTEGIGIDLFSQDGPQPRSCDHPGCDGSGEYPAPRAPDRLRDYYWFCLEHVREYNKAWNFCQGMNEQEIDAMVRADTCWQRPSWPLGGWRAAEERLRSHTYRFYMNGDDTAERTDSRAEDPADGNGRAHANGHGNGTGRGEGRFRRDFRAGRRPRTEEEKALTILDLSGPVDFATIKARYKTLVKQHHPDANNGSREAEEKLKSINRAYGTLKASYAS